MSVKVQTTKSFLEDLNDGITWEEEADVEEDISSDSSFDSSDEEEEDDAMDDEHENVAMQVEENAPAPAVAQAKPARQRIAPTNATVVWKKLSSHPRSQELLFRVAQSVETPMVRADIDWSILAAQIKSYPASEVGDERGSVLLQGLIRMDPPAFVVQKAVSNFPKSTVDMRAFYAACQFGYGRNDEVVELLMHHTMEARRREGIQWGMLAFLGDARVRTRHVKILLKGSPTAVIDPDYGVHGASPLDRMLSGALIHGDDIEWAAKLKIALLTARYGSVDAAMEREAAGGKGWFPMHSMIRRLISKDFMGVRFGMFTFTQTLSACLRSGFSYQNVDSNGNLPLHAALGRECNTNLETTGERKLIKFLLQAHPSAATTPDGNGMNPLRLAIQNGWLCYDSIIDASPQALHTKNSNGNLAIHEALNAKCHPRFGIKGARDIVRYLVREYPRAVTIPDKNGRLPLHLALENEWPCHDLLVNAAPRALETRDVTSMLYPFQIAACAMKENGDAIRMVAPLENTSIVYELVKHGASLFSSSGCVKNGTRKQNEMNSFLDDIDDAGLTLDDEAVPDDAKDLSSDDDDSSSDEDDEDIEQQPTAARGASSGQNAATEEEAAPLSYQLANTTEVFENLRAHSRSQDLLFRVARSRESPLIRAEIDWKSLSEQIKTFPAAELGDERGSVLLQGILCMDAPAYVVQKAVAVFPKACVDMEAFYASCQFGSNNDDVVELVMHHTLEERRKEGIQWGMLAFLGDARVSVRHARILLKGSPTAVSDPSHGMFGVSPLDRMLSGALIHGDDLDWLEKLKLALLTAKYGSVDSAVARENAGGTDWFPFHSLIRRLMAKDFMGVRFGKFTFVKTLKACLRSGFSCQNVDRRGDLPLHAALGRECNTNLGSAGERKLINFLLLAHPGVATIRDGNGGLPLRLAIQNGWPCYDIIVDSSPQTVTTKDDNGDLAFHVALNGKYHPRFGISGARDIVKYFLKKSPKSASIHDSKGRLPLHIAMENGWPCHDLIMAAAPRALDTRDLTTGLYPFQIAAIALRPKEDDDEETALRKFSILFELIGYGPLALTRGLSGESNESRKRKR